MHRKKPNPQQVPTKKNSTLNYQKPLSNRAQILYYSVFLSILTAIVFLPSLNNGFTNWDDGEYVVNNTDIKGFNIHNVVKVFSSTYVANYQPLTMISYMFDYQFFKLNPLAFHATNLLWHIGNGLLVFLLIFYLSGSKFTGLLTALLFAIHPLRVESVAWIAERKDVMSGFFYFLTLILYLKHLKSPRQSFYYISIGSFILSLLCKPMSVSLPVILLLIFYFKNGRPDKSTILKTVPFFIITIVFSIITLFAQNVLSPVGTDTFSLSILNRFCIPFYGILFYIFKSVIPLHLCSFYPFPAISETPILVTIAPLVVAGIITTGLIYRKRLSNILIFGMLFYFFTLLPVLQIIPVGNALVAERYSYIPCIGLFFPLVAFLKFLLKEKFQNKKSFRYGISAGVATLIVVFCWQSFSRCSVWKDSITLWNDVLNKYPVDAAYYFRGLAYSQQGIHLKAIDDFNNAISKNPKYALAFDARGTTWFNTNHYDRAIEDYSEAIRIIPKFATAYANRGTAYSKKGDLQNAIIDFSEAIKNYPKGAFPSYCNRGMAYGNIGKFDLAINDFSEAIKLNPGYIQVYYYRGLVYKASGETALAMSDMKTACNSGFDLACKALSGQ